MVATGEFVPQPSEQLEEEFDPSLEAVLAFEEAARRLDLEDWIVQRLRHAERELTVHLPRVADNGEVTTFTAFRIQHSTVRGPALGGVRLSPEAHLSQTRALAMAMTWQCALLGLPLGGSAGAIVCEPRRLSERELRGLTKDYVRALREFIGPFSDIVAPDIGCNERTMAWMCDSYARLRGHLDSGAVTGKPAALGGLSADSAGRALLLLVREILSERNTPLAGQRVAIQGFGDIGAAAASRLFEAGARIVAVSDVSGALYNERGLNIPTVRGFVARNGILFGFPEGEAISNDELLESPCDVLIPTADEKQITARNASRIRAAVVVEGTRHPVTRAADNILGARGALVIPEILGTAGSVLGSFFEWKKSVRHSWPTPAEMDECLKTRLQEAYVEVTAAARRYAIPLRQGAHFLAVDRVAAGLRFRR